MEAPRGDLNADDLRKEAARRMRMHAARRTALSTAGAARAEHLRVGLERRSAYTVVDFLSTAEVIGPADDDYDDDDNHDLAAHTAVAAAAAAARSGGGGGGLGSSPSFVCLDALAKSFG